MTAPNPQTPSPNSIAPRKPTLPICNTIAELVPKYTRQIIEALDRFDYGAAERAVESFIAKVDELCHPRDPVRVTALCWSATIAQQSGDLSKAFDEVEKGIQFLTSRSTDISESAYGSAPGLLLQLRTLKAELHTDAGQHSKAMAVWSDVLEMTEALQSKVRHYQLLKLSGLLGMACAAAAGGDTPLYSAKMAEALCLSGRIEVPSGQLAVAQIIANSGRKEASAGRFDTAAALVLEATNIAANCPDVKPPYFMELRNEAAEFFEKAGNFSKALTMRYQLLRETQDKLGSESKFACTLRDDIATSLVERGRFEEAELLLQENLEVARKRECPEDTLAAAVALCEVLEQKNMLVEIHELLDSISQEITATSNPLVQIQLDFALAQLYLRRGDTDRSISIIKGALERCDKVSFPHNLIQDTILHYHLALIYCGKNSEAAQHHLDAVYEKLQGLPPDIEPISNAKLRLLSLRISNDAEGSSLTDNLCTKEIEQHIKLHGSSNYLGLAHLLLGRAYLRERAGDSEAAIHDLQTAREGLEVRNRSDTLVYAKTLSLLATLLPDDDPQGQLFLEKSVELFRRLGRSMME